MEESKVKAKEKGGEWDKEGKSQKVLSHNMDNGMGNMSKMKEVLTYFGGKTPLAVFLQEVGVSKEDMKEDKFGRAMGVWMPGYDMWTSLEPNRHRRGVIILMPRGMSHLVCKEKVVRDENGCFLAVPCRTGCKGQLIWFVNVYVPPETGGSGSGRSGVDGMSEFEHFYSKVMVEMSKQIAINAGSSDLMVVGMDANCTREPRLDVEWELYQEKNRAGNIVRQCKKASMLEDWMEAMKLKGCMENSNMQERGCIVGIHM